MREGDWMSWGELQREQMTDEDKEIALWVSDKMPQLVKDLTRICRIPSVAVVTEDKKPPYGPECVRVLDEMLQIGKEYGLDTKNFDSCVGRIRYGDGEKSIGIWSHLDVVPVGGYWEHDPFEPVVEQGYMIARGCQDNKSSAVMALYVLLYMKEHKIKLPYSLDAYMGTSEEVGMFDIDHFVAHYQCPELSLVPDSGFPVCCGERGSFNGELTANDSVSERLISLSCDCGLYSVPNIAEAVVRDAPRIKELISSRKSSVTVEQMQTENGKCAWKLTACGITAHGASPKSGSNALTILCEAICRYELASENDCKVLSWIISINKDCHGTQLGAFFEDEISGPTILTVTQGWIRDGHLVFGFLSKYPAGCKEDLAVIAEKKANENGFSLSVTRNTKPTLFDPKHPAVTIMTDTYNRLTKNHEKPFVMSGGTYARKLPRAFACGTGMPLPPAPERLFQKGHGDYHQPDEAISLKRVEMALVIYIKGILEICRKVTL